MVAVERARARIRQVYGRVGASSPSPPPRHRSPVDDGRDTAQVFAGIDRLLHFSTAAD